MMQCTTRKLNYVGISTVKLLSPQTSGAGKNTAFSFNNPKPTVLPSEPMPSTPFPTMPHPAQIPVIEIPGPIVEPSLPQPYPKSQPQREIKPATDIPVPIKNAEKCINTQASVEDDVIIKDIGNKGVISLNRPKALNALNLSMVEKIYPALKKWETTKKLVIIEGMGDKAFCAGGDVKSLVTAITEADDKVLGETFFRKEYTVNHLIGTYKIPYVALIDGITMGGGVGLSVHGKYRVATEKTLFAMPETAIGLFPDVGGTYFLPRLRGQLGLYLGLTGDRLRGLDVFLAGVATHFVPSEKLSDLKEELLRSEDPNVTDILNKYQPKNLDHEFCLAPHIKQIDDCFSAFSVEDIIERLKKDGSEWAEKTVQTLCKVSPSSLKITKRGLEKGKNLSLADCLKMEFRLSCSALNKTSDFCEGVRALLIDKDQKPIWNPKSLNGVTDTLVNQKFTDLPADKELQL